MVYSNIQNKVDKNSSATLSTIELVANIPYIDFHFNSSTSDFTSRIIESSAGTLTIQNNLYAKGYIDSPKLCISGTDVYSIFPTITYTNNLVSNLSSNMKIRHTWQTLQFTNGVSTFTYTEYTFTGNTSVIVQSRDPNSSLSVRYAHFNYVSKVVTVGLSSMSYNSTLGISALFIGPA